MSAASSLQSKTICYQSSYFATRISEALTEVQSIGIHHVHLFNTALIIGQFLTRRLAECTQAVIILRNTIYIAIELKYFAFEVVQIQSNRCA